MSPLELLKYLFISSVFTPSIAEIKWTASMKDVGALRVSCPSQKIQLIDAFYGVHSIVPNKHDCLVSIKNTSPDYYNSIHNMCQWKNVCDVTISTIPTRGTHCNIIPIFEYIVIEYQCLAKPEAVIKDQLSYSRCNTEILNPDCLGFIPSYLKIQDAFFGVQAISPNCNQSTRSADDFLVRIRDKDVRYHREIEAKCSGRRLCQDLIAKGYQVYNPPEIYHSDYVKLIYTCEAVISERTLFIAGGCGCGFMLLMIITIALSIKNGCKRRANSQNIVATSCHEPEEGAEANARSVEATLRSNKSSINRPRISLPKFEMQTQIGKASPGDDSNSLSRDCDLSWTFYDIIKEKCIEVTENTFYEGASDLDMA